MKNSIKLITILGIAISCLPAYSMVAPNGHMLELDELRYVNPLLHMNKLTVWPFSGGHNIPDDDQFFNRRDGLAFKLTIIKFFGESDKTKKKDTLEVIYNAIRDGKPITSKHDIGPNLTKSAIIISPCQNPTSAFMLIEDWFKYVWFADKSKKDDLKITIFQGERERKGQLKYICDKLEENKIPKDLEPEFLSYLPGYNVSEERTALIEQAEQEFHEEKQSQFSLFKMSAYLERTLRNITDCE